MKAEKLGKKIANFWFYRKWDIIIIGFILLGVFFLLRQCNAVGKTDVTALMMVKDTSLSYEQRTGLEDTFADYADDVNRDGLRLVTIETFNFSSSQKQSARTVVQLRLDGQLQAGDGFLCVTDENEYSVLAKEHMFAKLSDVLPGIKTRDAYRISCADLPELQGKPYSASVRGLYLSVLPLNGTAAQQAKKRPQYDEAVTLLRRLAQNKPVASQE